MKAERISKQQLVSELNELSQRINDLERLETRHRSEEEKLTRLDSLLMFISNLNQSILTIKDENELFQQICDSLLEEVWYVEMAWIGIVEKGSYEVKPVAQAGFDDGYLDSVKVTWDDSPLWQRPHRTFHQDRQALCYERY